MNASEREIEATPPRRRLLVRAIADLGLAFRRNSISAYAFSLGALLLLMVLAPKIFVNIPAGNVGVLWLRFGGTVTDGHLGEGIHTIFPWNEVYIYDARLQNRARVYDTISSNGLGMQVDIVIRYRINSAAVGSLHQLVGPHYDEVLVFPEIGAQARELISRYTPEQLYSETRGFIQAQILQRMVTRLGGSPSNQGVRGQLVDVEDVLIRSISLPPLVKDAIERKAEQYQAMLEYDFRIEREKKERERKKIEAEGVREFQDTVARTITPEYLRLRGIEATMSLATSPNAKVIIIGGKDGLPLILNTGDEAAGSAAGVTDAKTADPATASTAPPPPNARLGDTTPQNAIAPIDRSLRSPGRPPAPPKSPAPSASAANPAGLPDQAAEPPPSPAAQAESANRPASKELDLIDHVKSLVPAAPDSGKP